MILRPSHGHHQKQTSKYPEQTQSSRHNHLARRIRVSKTTDEF
jgi:hypothetical protein